MVIAEISVIPLGTKTPSVSEHVARAVRTLAQQKGIKYQLTGMGTLLEGELNDVLEAAKKMHLSLFDAGVQRVVTTIKLDDRRDKALTLDHKVQSVTKKLG